MDAANASFLRRTINVFGALGVDRCYVRTAKSRNTGDLIKFLKGENEIRPNATILLDDASYHKSRAVRKFVKGAPAGQSNRSSCLRTPHDSIPRRPRGAPSDCCRAAGTLRPRGTRGGHHVVGSQGPDASGQDHAAGECTPETPARVRDAARHPSDIPFLLNLRVFREPFGLRSGTRTARLGFVASL